MRIIFGADHGGVLLKNQLLNYASQLGYEVIDVGTNTTEAVDYADIAARAAQLIQQHQADYGVLICRTGIGMSISANRFKGIRAAVAYHPAEVVLSRKHNDANILCFGADFIKPTTAKRYLKVWLLTDFSQEERHRRRVNKIDLLE